MPEVQDAIGQFSWTGDLNASFDTTSGNIDSAKYFINRKYRNLSDTTTDREIKFEGTVTSADPANLNLNTVGLADPKSPGVFIGDINGSDINISGKVEGTIDSDDQLNINQSADIKGTIEYTSLKVSYGARVQGRIQHKGVVHSFNNVEEDSHNNNLEEDAPNESNEDNI